ncbi:MAG TPA: hypothetical protein IAC47_03355 [Candidatus Onthomorpha intestinigallinarum]|uniref:Uncharacterized protein n=1 Tax=Candidatus Onthomorpha intestinigallinarum TaxID=2840880 RepID=A0A9D1RH43_9BACT|nr:hypothetical protein [Candidatus Onthomorpha intestinigallinarum]
MPLNPTLKNVFIRTLNIVVSPIAYWMLYRVLFLIWPSLEIHNTIDGIWQFAVALAVIWFNIRKLAKPIQLVTIGMYLFLFAVMMFWYKTEPFLMWFYDSSDASPIWIQSCNYRMMRILCCFGFILLASVLPIFFRTSQASYLAPFGKIWIWATILMLDFAAAMPNIYFSEQQADKLYMGFRKMGDTYKYAPIYAIGNTYYCDVLIPQDSVHTSSEHYLKVYYERHGNLLIQPETRDTIWIEKGGVWANPNRQTIENNTSCLMRWQWQYYAWHKVKGLFCKNENE